MKKNAGFISLTITAFIIIAGSLAYTANKSLDNHSKVNVTENNVFKLNESETALGSFVKLSGRLPCPSKIRGGKEDCSLKNQKGWLPTKTLVEKKIINNQISDEISNIRYLVYRSVESPIDLNSPNLLNLNPPDLATNTDVYKPYISSKSIAEEVSSEVISLNDFCQKLKNIKGLTNLSLANIPLSEQITSNRINIAYAIAVSNGNEFSPINASENPEMESPARIQNGIYNDSVRAIGTLSLKNLLGCENNFLAMDSLQIAGKEIQTQIERKTSLKANIQQDILYRNVLLNLNIAFYPHQIQALVKYIPADVSISIGRIDSDILRCLTLLISACLSIPPEAIITAEKAARIGSTVASLAFATYSLLYKSIILNLEMELLKELQNFTIWDERAAIINNSDLLSTMFEIKK